MKSSVGVGKLCDHGEGLRGVDFAAGLVVGFVERIGVLPASALVAYAGLGTFIARATVNTVLGAGMRRDLSGDFVGLPYIKLVAAYALGANVALKNVRTIFEYAGQVRNLQPH